MNSVSVRRVGLTGSDRSDELQRSPSSHRHTETEDTQMEFICRSWTSEGAVGADCVYCWPFCPFPLTFTAANEICLIS